MNEIKIYIFIHYLLSRLINAHSFQTTKAHGEQDVLLVDDVPALFLVFWRTAVSVAVWMTSVLSVSSQLSLVGVFPVTAVVWLRPMALAGVFSHFQRFGSELRHWSTQWSRSFKRSVSVCDCLLPGRVQVDFGWTFLQPFMILEKWYCLLSFPAVLHSKLVYYQSNMCLLLHHSTTNPPACMFWPCFSNFDQFSEVLVEYYVNPLHNKKK